MLSKYTELQNSTDPSPHIFRISGVLENIRIKLSVENNNDFFFNYPFSPLCFGFFHSEMFIFLWRVMNPQVSHFNKWSVWCLAATTAGISGNQTGAIDD